MGRIARASSISLCALTLLFCTAEMSVAQQRSLTKQQARLYLRNLPAVDKVELVKVSPDGKENVEDLKVEGRVFIEGAQARKLAALWRAQAYAPDRSACHEPAYAVRFFVKGKELVYASVCWGCSNILFFAPDFVGGLHFEGDNKNGQKLEQFFRAAFSETKQAKSSAGFSSNPSNRKQ
jgi:hypothetical protein